MTSITNTIQLDVFSLIRDILRGNTEIAKKFTINDFYQFEPNIKGVTFRGYPYILIRIPKTDTDNIVLDRSKTIRDFTIPILLRMEYHARDKFTNYATNIINELDGSTATTSFESFGYFNTEIDIISISDKTIIDEEQILEGEFELKLIGNVNK